MSRTVKDAQLATRAARGRLPARGKPYWRALDPGLALGYRRPSSGAGRWVVRFYTGTQRYRTDTIATADDLSTANGVDVLDFTQAQEHARQARDERALITSGKGGPLTVAGAIDRYIEALEGEGRNPADTLARVRAMILPTQGDIEVAQLTAERIRSWVRDMVSKPPRLRTGRGQPQRYRVAAQGEEAIRRRRNTVNRVTAILKAALTHSFRDGLVASDQAWRRVKLFEDVSAARVRYLTVEEARRLINASDPDFRDLVQAALQTGARYSELGRLRVQDFNRDSETLHVTKSKSSKKRHIVLTEEGVDLFTRLCAGRARDQLILRRVNGQPWGPSNQIKPMAEACRRAGIHEFSFHGLRHTYASLSVMSGAPLMVVAESLGHADVRMVTKHYGHMSKSFVATAIRTHAPRFGTVETDNVTLLRK
jgi:integrase